MVLAQAQVHGCTAEMNFREAFEPYFPPLVNDPGEEAFEPYFPPLVNDPGEEAFEPYFPPLVNDPGEEAGRLAGVGHIGGQPVRRS